MKSLPHSASLLFLASLMTGCTSDGDGDTGTAQPDAMTVPTIEDYVGIWTKDRVGDALIVENDCGNYWRLDFDYAHSRISQESATTLTMEHCSDAACTEVDSISSTLTWDGTGAMLMEESDVEASADCTIRSTSSTTLRLETASEGSLRWQGNLHYMGEGCAPFIAEETEGDRCQAVAETIIRRAE